MATQTFDITGEGYEDLSGGTFTPIAVGEIEAFITTAGYVDFRSASPPRRVMHGGWIALGYWNGTYPDEPVVMWHNYMEFDRHNLRPGRGEVGGTLNCVGFFYALPAGVEWHIVIYY